MNTTTPNSNPTLRIGVLYEGVQLSDILAIDMLGNISVPYIQAGIAAFPQMAAFAEPLLAQAINIDFRYVASTLDPTETTPGIKILPTHTYESCDVTDLDVLLVGGNFPSARTEASLALLRRFVFGDKEGGEGKANKAGRTLMTTCVGSMWAAEAGVLKGRKATTNRGGLGMAKGALTETEWLDRRWVVDSKEGEVEVWSSGGAMAGLDMFCKWMLEKFPKEMVLHGLSSLDFDVKGKGEEYDEPMPAGFDDFAKVD